MKAIIGLFGRTAALALPALHSCAGLWFLVMYNQLFICVCSQSIAFIKTPHQYLYKS
jgi:hypothetical protein